MAFKPGQTGNPKGRPLKERALTEILKRGGASSVDVGGKTVAGRQLLAQLLWTAATTGKVQLDGVDRILDVDEWVSIVKFIYAQVDGPPPQKVQHGGDDGNPIVVEHALRDAIEKVYGNNDKIEKVYGDKDNRS